MRQQYERQLFSYPKRRRMNHTSRHIEKGAKYHLCHAVLKRKWGQALLASRQCVTDNILSKVSLRRSRFLGAFAGDWPLGHYSGQYHGWHEHHRRRSGIRWLPVNTVVTGGEPVEFISWCEGTSPTLLSANLRGACQEIWILGRLALFIVFSGSVKPVVLYNIARLWLIIYTFMAPLFHFYLLSVLFIHDATD